MIMENVNLELNKFYISLMQDISAIQISDEEGAISEQIFTQQAVNLLASAGESENVFIRYDEKGLGTSKQHKINAYAVSENYETVDLFISIFNGTDEIKKISAQEIETAAKRVLNFFRKAIYSDESEKNKYFKTQYIDEIEESSEIFDFAFTLSRAEDIKENLIRVNAFILTNGLYNGKIPQNVSFSKYSLYYKVFDIDSLYKLSKNAHLPIEINFDDEKYKIPCLEAPLSNEVYRTFVVIMPGEVLAAIYERFGSRLLEQNVRSFLQFSGKINKGIRGTVMNEPHMFLAFNNGIVATAEEVITTKKLDANYISYIKDLQIVNGGQTTASLFHTKRRDKSDISNIYVQLKLIVINERNNFSSIVSRVAEYANTQNKVSVSDLSSNHPFFVNFEKLSRLLFAPQVAGNSFQSRWFFERARGQYKNERAIEGRTKAKLASFDRQNPRKQLFTKEDLAKYVNSYNEVIKTNRVVIGPHIVVRGNQKNHKAFIDFNLPSESDSIYYEDFVAKAILFRKAEKIYGIKPNAIGDLRFITVPYSISYLNYKLKNPVNLYRIWEEQDLSEPFDRFLLDLMKKVESFIKSNAPGSLFGEWAKKEECWTALKKSNISFDISDIDADLVDTRNPPVRKKKSTEIISLMSDTYETDGVSSISQPSLFNISKWGSEEGRLTADQMNIINAILEKKQKSLPILYEETIGLKEILSYVADEEPDLLKDQEIDEISDDEKLKKRAASIIEWIKINDHPMKTDRYTFIKDLRDGRKSYSIQNKMALDAISKYLYSFGFNEEQVQ